jgi:iron complex transport system ATP-binding protein
MAFDEAVLRKVLKLIVAKNITYKVGSKTILNDFSTTIQPGKLTVILGPNGAGKSTLMKCLTGSLRPSAGTITLDGRYLEDYPLQELAQKRAVLSQSNPISFPFKALEIVRMGRNPYQQKKEKAGELEISQLAIESVEAWHLRDRIFMTLSGGEQQRIQLARVLAQVWEKEHSFLFLDEPTSALDLKHQYHLLELFRELCNEKKFTIVIVMHDIKLASQFTDMAILMKHGCKSTDGDSKEVISAQNICELYGLPTKYLNHVF